MAFIQTHLQATDLNLLVTGIVTVLLSLYFFCKEKYTYAAAILFAGALCLRLMMAHIDPFIYWWDEQYHALVAKNLLQHPGTPMLVANPVLGYDMTNWTENHIWVHKQPLFLWQIALSFKLFGTNEFALRLPSALMSALTVLLVYRTGKIALDAKTGYVAAFLFTLSYMQLNIVTGSVHTDHNDVAFMFYVMASIWAFVEYLNKPSYGLAMLTGLLAGCAVLNKWLTGLLVFAGWGMYLLSNRTKRFTLGHYRHLFVAFIMSLVIFMPWQWHIHSGFPAESRYEMTYNTGHFFTPVEGHGGDAWYHFDQIAFLFGKMAPFLILPALFVFYKKARRPYRFLLLFYVVLTYVFFTLAATKMPLFCNIVAPVLYIFFACLLLEIMQKLFSARKNLYRILLPLAMIITGWITIDFKSMEMNHTSLSGFPHIWRVRTHNTALIKKAVKEIPSQDHVVLNCRNPYSTLVMFYSGCTAYDFMGSREQYAYLKSKGVKMAVFVTDDLPDYYKNDGEVIKLDYQLY